MTMAAPEKSVLFIDVDGVLIIGRNPERTHWATDLQRTFGFDKAALRQHFFQPFWADIVTGKDSLLPRLEEALNAMGSDVKAAALRDFWFANDAQKNEELLEWLAIQRRSGTRVMLATNQDHDRAHYLIDDLGLGKHVDGIYHSAALGVAKPDRAFFETIASQEQLAASQCIFVDDTIANVETARRLGWRTIHYIGQSPDQLTKALVNVD